MADYIRPTPRNPLFGLFSDIVNVPLDYMSDPRRTQQMQGMASFIRGTGVPSTLQNLAYDPSGRGLFTGAGGLGGTTRMRPEAIEALMTVAPMVGPVARMTKGLPVGMSIKDIREGLLPSPKSLTMPSVPTVEQMQQYGRTEVVPLSQAVSFQSARNWDKFNAGKGPGDLVPGFGDKPLALRLETGEYVIYDGNHRTDLALQKGQTALPMHVIDVKSYDPAHAGRKPVPDKMSTEDLLSALFGDQPQRNSGATPPTYTDPFANTIGDTTR